MTAAAPLDHVRRAGARPAWWWAAGVAVVWLLLQVLLAPSAVVYPDTARYGSMALQLHGTPAADADLAGVTMLCADRGEQAARANAARVLPLGPAANPAKITADCLAAAGANLEPTTNPRYVAIFDTRPGYPIFVAAVMPVLGLKVALWAVPVGATVLAGLLVWLLLRELGATAAVAAGGQLLVYVSPLGWWGAQMLTEGPILAGTVAAVLGAVWLLRARTGLGAAMMLAGLVLVGMVKFSTALPLAVGLAVAGCAALLVRADTRGALLVSGIGGITAAVIVGLSHAFGWPGLSETAQDLFALHFTHPDVPNVTSRLVAADWSYIVHWLRITWANLLLLAGAAVGGWALWRRSRAVALVVAAAAAVGPALALAHPDVLEGDRLYVLAWLLVAVGVPLAATGWAPSPQFLTHPTQGTQDHR